MNALPASEDDREEGEIVDDDLEDISDNSIIDPRVDIDGKCVCPVERLRAISLSSLSDDDVVVLSDNNHHNKKRKRRKTRKRKRRHSYRSPNYPSDSEDTSTGLARKLQSQLKAAIHVDFEESHKNNSLRTRLKVMTGDLEPKDKPSDAELSAVHSDSKDSNKESEENDIDTELIQLRLEALKTAFLNKLGTRRKRKCKDINNETDNSKKPDETETNKENAITVNNYIGNKKTEDTLSSDAKQEGDLLSPEDDPDILRAMLLASMSRKIIGKSNDVNKVSTNSKESAETHPKKVQARQNLFKINRAVKRDTVALNNKPTLRLPEVKPLIININADSDTDEDTCAIKPNLDMLKIESSIDKLLKEERTKVEAQRLSNLDTESTNSILSKSSSATTRVHNQLNSTSLSLQTTNNTAGKTPSKPFKFTAIEKSAVKLLPKNKQIEYQRLMQRLRAAEKNIKTKSNLPKISKVLPNSNSVIKKVNKTKNVTPNVPSANSVGNIVDRKAEAISLQVTLRQMQEEKNGRLQIQEKYRALNPAMRKINEASKERKKCDQEVKRLLVELAEAKKKQFESQKTYTAAVQELYQQKEKLDRESLEKLPAYTNNIKQVTSKSGTVTKNSSKITQTIAPTEKLEDRNEHATKIVTAPVIDEINLGDPNDIDLVMNKQREKVPQYISPLDSVNREENLDPFSILCPFEVGGRCKDPECTYKHLCR